MKMKLISTALFALALCVPATAMAAPAKMTPATGCQAATVSYTADQMSITGTNADSSHVKEILAVFNDLVQASNKHALADILKHYNPSFISGDNLTLEQVKNLIQETWKNYPDICYESKPIELRINGDWATIETMDRSFATAPPDKEILDTPGRLSSQSRSMLFLRRMGSTWEITSDSTLWEQAVIRYGISDDVNISLSAPEQVKAGQSYSATIVADVPEGTFTIATIDNQALTYPHQKVDDKFRPLGAEAHDLQRVLKANTANHNEIVTATLGLTAVEQTNPDRPSLSLNGIATIIKRVNVVPISAEDVMREMQKREQVKTSANGQIDLSDKAPKLEGTRLPDIDEMPGGNTSIPDEQ